MIVFTYIKVNNNCVVPLNRTPVKDNIYENIDDFLLDVKNGAIEVKLARLHNKK